MLKSVDGDADMKEVGERFRVVGRESVFRGRGLSVGVSKGFFCMADVGAIEDGRYGKSFYSKNGNDCYSCSMFPLCLISSIC